MTGGSGDCAGSVLVATEELHRRGVPVVWAYRSDPSTVPAWATRVRAGTARHRWLAARSRWWLTDGLPMRVSGPDTVGRPLERGRDTVVVALVEPTVERVGRDIVDWPLLTPRQQHALMIRGDVDVDHVLAPSLVHGERQARVLGYSAPVTTASVLTQTIPDAESSRLHLGVGADVDVVGVFSSRGAADAVVTALEGMDSVAAIAAANDADRLRVVGCSSIVVTDTSGWAAVAARAGIPVIVCASDLRDLLSRGPGLYLPWQSELPGPCVAVGQELRAAIDESRGAAWRTPRAFASGHASLAALADDGRPPGQADVLAILESLT